MKRPFAAWAACAICVLVGCLVDGRRAGRGSEVENEVYGVLVDADGNGVQGARVRAIPAAPASDTDTVLTGAGGRYAFDSLAAGAYDLLGDYRSGSLVVYIPAVQVADSGKFVGVDTLRPPGRIRGRLLSGGRGVSAALCFVPGTSYLAVSDDSGFCTISGVPQGVYRVGYSVPGFLVPTDTGVVVRASLTTDLPVKELEYDPSYSPPTPTGLRAVYDTAGERTALFWDAVPVSDLAGFVVYRDEGGFPEPPPIMGGFTTKTSFVDSTFGPLANGEKRILIYRVKAKDKEANVSGRFSAPCSVEAVSRSFVATVGAFSVERGPHGLATPRDTVRVILAYSNPRRAIVSAAWTADTSAIPLRTVVRAGREGEDTLVYVPDSPGTKHIRAVLADETGAHWEFATDLEVVADPPLAVLRVPAHAFAGDTVRVDWSGSSDGAGMITKVELRVGGAGNFATVSGKDSLLGIPAAARGEYRIELRVTDDDGYTAVDAGSILVAGRGKWTRLTDSAYPINQGQFKVAETGGRSWILSREGVYSSADRVRWDSAGRIPDRLLGDGVLAAAGYQNLLFCFVRNSYGYLSILGSSNGAAWRAIGDSLAIGPGNALPLEAAAVAFQDRLFLYASWGAARLTTEIWSWGGTGAWKRESAQPPFGGRMDIHPVEWSGRLWIYGGQTNNAGAGGLEDDIWSSSDGVVWTKAADSVGGYRHWAQILPCGDHLALAGGDDESGRSRSDTWASLDGARWMEEDPAPGFIGLAVAEVVRGGTAGYLYGGLNRDKGWQKSIWKCE